MKRTFTARLPVRASREVRQAIEQRALTDSRLTEFVQEDLLAAKKKSSDPDLLAFAIASVERFADLVGESPEWVSDHIAAAYRALANFREAYKETSRNSRAVTTESLRHFLSRSQPRAGTHALVDRKSAFGYEWEQVEQRLLELISTNENWVHLSVRSVGDIEVRGAGLRTLGANPRIVRIYLEHRGDRQYLTAVVTHHVRVQRVPLNRDYEGVISVAINPATIVADSAGVAASRMVAESRSILALSRQTRKHRTDGSAHRRAARKMMDARNNYFRQYAVRLATYAQERQQAVAVVLHEGNARTADRVLGATARHRRILMREIFHQCAARGVVFMYPRTTAVATYRHCGHRNSVIAAMLHKFTIVAACEECLAANPDFADGAPSAATA